MAANPKQRVTIVPKSAQVTYERFHFPQATRVGDTVWVSGQTGLDAHFRPAEGVEAQTRLAFEALKAVLAEAGASLGDVVDLITFHTDLHGQMAAFVAVKDEFFPSHYPSWTAIGISQLAVPGLVLEVRATAVVGSAPA